MPDVTAIYGSPRRKGNTALLLGRVVEGIRASGHNVTEVFLRDMKMSPCLEIYGCKSTGRCAIQDDFQKVYDLMLDSKGIVLASPVFFYNVSAQTKILMDRCQSLWVKKYWIDQIPFGSWDPKRKALFVSAAATGGKRLFEGSLLTVKYFFDVLDAELIDTLLCRGLDYEGDVLKKPEYLDQAYDMGKAFAADL